MHNPDTSKPSVRRARRLLASLAAAGTMFGTVGLGGNVAHAATEGSGSASYLSCLFNWTNYTDNIGTGHTDADTSNAGSCVRTRAQVYYYNGSSWIWSTNGWGTYYSSVSRNGPGVQSKHSADVDTTGAFGYITRNFIV